MRAAIVDEKNAYLDQLQKLFKKELSKTKAEQVYNFAKAYYLNVPVTELADKDVSDVCGQTISAWEFIQDFKDQKPKVHIFNPSASAKQWCTSHTIVMILHPDAPFLVDSVRMELSHREINIHAVQSLVAQVKRNKNGKLMDTATCSYEEGCPISMKDYINESFMYFEIDRVANKESIKEVADALENVLSDVRAVVADFSAMKGKVISLITELDDAKVPVLKSEVQETQTYLKWLLDQNFTFLGYKEYEIVTRNKKKVIKYIPDAELGIVKRRARSIKDKTIESLIPTAQEYILNPQLLSFSKSGTMSTVHRPAYPVYVGIRKFNAKGEVIGERGFLGLYTLPVYTERSQNIPIIRSKIEAVMARSGLYPFSHEGKELERVLETYPRTELFQIGTDELFKTATGIAQIKERQQTRLFVRKDFYGKFYTCFVLMPRERYSTEIRHKVEEILCRSFKALNAQFTTYFGESILVRTHFALRANPTEDFEYDVKKIEQEIINVTSSWQDSFAQGLIDTYGEEEGIQLGKRYKNAFPSSYRDSFAGSMGVVDLPFIQSLNEDNNLSLNFNPCVDGDVDVANFDLFHLNDPLPLSDVIPILENMGLKVIGEHPFKIVDREGVVVWNHDFNMIYRLQERAALDNINDIFTEAFDRVWHGHMINDSYNRLVLAAGLNWRQVSFLRGLGHYMKQIKMGFSQDFLAGTLLRNLGLTKILVDYFDIKLNPELSLSQKQRDTKLDKLEKEYLGLLEDVASLSEDRVLRRYMEINKAILRTNYFQKDANGDDKLYCSYKLNPHLLPDIPLPRPMFEIFVYSSRVEGVHLRGGKVARGGLRWSDRQEDYRTEVLGLVKAQQVKNAVIVPVGAKGGFVPQNLDGITDRDAFQEEGIACYKVFIRGLLDVSDNIVEGKVVPPKSVVRYDEDDPYLVVAADKGTATFSDISNGLADEYGFWLGDAFASGGSQGYDHKGMAITAKGAWVSVQRHFRERGLNVQETPFSVVAVGDMAGDVFGNGMLLSKYIQLVAAFNHLHIFIDPDPDPAKSFKERQRLFDLPRSSWEDYNTKLMSKGGGIFLRSAKSIPISPEMQKRFGIKAKSMTPNDLLHALLKAPIDLFWNGGIGTYVKASSETHADVGDKANDCIRVDGSEFKAKVAGEGGNLGMTQLGRVEYALAGGASNTDFIDNAGGVDCSDHEVNIKILLAKLMAEGKLTSSRRNKLLVDMTDTITELVLKNNYRQVQALSIAQAQAIPYMNEYRHFINKFEESGQLNRELEFLPSDDALAKRATQGQALTRPELSVLISYSKAELKEVLVDTGIPDDAHIAQEVEMAFPPELVKKYKKDVYAHQLRREIISTQLANDVVNNMGITFVQRMRESTDASFEQVLRAYVISRDIFGMLDIWHDIEALDNKVPSETQLDMMRKVIRLVRHGTRWFLKHRKAGSDVTPIIAHFSKGVAQVAKDMPTLQYGEPLKEKNAAQAALEKQGVPKKLANTIACAGSLYFSLDIIEAAAASKVSVKDVSQVFFNLSNKLDLHWFRQQINHIPVENHWHAKVRDAFRDDVDWQLRSLTKAVLGMKGAPKQAEKRVDYWMAEHEELLERWQQMQKGLREGSAGDLAMYAVAIRELMELERQG